MLFNSYIFIFAFLPVVIGGFFLIARGDRPRAAVAWLVGASLFFYGWWDYRYLALLLFSIAFNFGLGNLLSSATTRPARGRMALAGGVAVNLALLGYFKYANFFVDSLNELFEVGLTLERIVLPLAISFFTFQQIAYLVDSHRGLTREHSLLDYCLFVTFFPQLIAGPIVHHKEMLPQFARPETYRPSAFNLSVGSTIFIIGLFKKVVLADSVAPFANTVFLAADAGAAPTFSDAWAGALAYTLQLYFDFSGYSDMAIGLAALFGITLPVNFNSPYKATSIVDFWRRWHITLSRFLRDYLYIPLGGNRKGPSRRYVNLMITMLLGGLWHGAGWTFVVWGGLHGLYLCVNHAWSKVRPWPESGPEAGMPRIAWRIGAVGLTMIAVVLAWVFFRATSFSGAARMLEAMSGARGFELASAVGLTRSEAVPLIAALLPIALLAPNSHDIMSRCFRPLGWAPSECDALLPPSVRRVCLWRPGVASGVGVALFGVAAILFVSRANEFLYFQF